jgi:hypothetical protein
MRKILFDPACLPPNLRDEWDAWQLRACSATKEIIDAWEAWRERGSVDEFEPDFNPHLWAELKAWLLDNVFHGKCAYCEIAEVRSPLHADHYRPKGAVKRREEGRRRRTVRAETVRTFDEDGQEVKHPGYFWLAYHWMNLLPSCFGCNAKDGKRSFFPATRHIMVHRVLADDRAKLRIQKIESSAREGVFYLEPADLDLLEQPELLHPYIDDPSDHLVFGQFGTVAPRDGSARGRASVETFDLKADRLLRARQAAQEKAYRDYALQLLNSQHLPLAAQLLAARQAVEDIIDGRREFSASALAWLREQYPHHGL